LLNTYVLPQKEKRKQTEKKRKPEKVKQEKRAINSNLAPSKENALIFNNNKLNNSTNDSLLIDKPLHPIKNSDSNNEIEHSGSSMEIKHSESTDICLRNKDNKLNSSDLKIEDLKENLERFKTIAILPADVKIVNVKKRKKRKKGYFLKKNRNKEQNSELAKGIQSSFYEKFSALKNQNKLGDIEFKDLESTNKLLFSGGILNKKMIFKQRDFSKIADILIVEAIFTYHIQIKKWPKDSRGRLKGDVYSIYLTLHCSDGELLFKSKEMSIDNRDKTKPIIDRITDNLIRIMFKD